MRRCGKPLPDMVLLCLNGLSQGMPQGPLEADGLSAGLPTSKRLVTDRLGIFVLCCTLSQRTRARARVAVLELIRFSEIAHQSARPQGADTGRTASRLDVRSYNVAGI